MERIELVPVFQPIVDTAGGIQCIGYEALIRGRQFLRLYGAKEVFEHASEFGGSKVLDERIRDLEVEVGLPLLNGNQRLFLNLPTQACFEFSWQVLMQDAKEIVLEVSEHARLSDGEIAWLNDFRRDGIQIAIDDFGVGRTDLRMLSAIRPEYVKLDLSFVRNRDFETVRRMRRFAEDWGTTLIVEGVETDAEARSVMDAGVRYIQGFFYGKPHEVTYWLSHRVDQPRPSPVPP